MIARYNGDEVVNERDPAPLYLQVGDFKVELTQDGSDLVVRGIGPRVKLAIIPSASNAIRLRRTE